MKITRKQIVLRVHAVYCSRLHLMNIFKVVSGEQVDYFISQYKISNAEFWIQHSFDG